MNNSTADKNIRPLLTIVIPTYNGEKYIAETLDSIIFQFNNKFVYSNINVLISDNKSEDNTYVIVHEYMKKYQNIQYYCNNENLGADINFDLAVRKADGEYVWILSDDDYLKENSIIKVLNVIKCNTELSSIYINYLTINSYTKEIYRYKAVNIKKDILCKDGNEFFKLTKFTSSLVSTVIIRKADWIRIQTNKYYGCSYIHFAVLIEALVNSKCYIIAEPYLVERYVIRKLEKDWSKGTKVLTITMNLAELFNGMYSLGYEKKLINNVCNKMKRQNLKLIVKLKSKDINIGQTYIDRMNDIYGKYNIHFIVSNLLLKIPNKVYAFALKVTKRGG